MDLRKIDVDSKLSIENETADLIIQDNLSSSNSKNLIKFEKYCMDPKKTMNYIAKSVISNYYHFRKISFKMRMFLEILVMNLTYPF